MKNIAFGRSAALFLLFSVLAFVIGNIVNAVPAAATDYAARGPSVGADEYADQFVFWRGSTNSELYEAFYNKHTNTWWGPINLWQMGTLGSEPTVAAADVGGYLHNGYRIGAQYVYWKGNDGDLWYAYWAGSWYGPIDTGIGNIASEPSAAFNDVGGSSQVTVFWKSTLDDSLWYVRITNPASGAPTYYGPHAATYKGQGFGVLGSSPGASESAPTGPGPGAGIVTWKGSTNKNLYEADYSINAVSGALSFTSGPLKTSYNNLNGGPSCTLEYNINNINNMLDYYYAWEDSYQNLWFGSGPSATVQPAQKIIKGGLGSAPSIAWSAGTPNDKYIFWKGQDGYLKEAYFNGAAWKYYSYSQFGILG